MSATAVKPISLQMHLADLAITTAKQVIKHVSMAHAKVISVSAMPMHQTCASSAVKISAEMSNPMMRIIAERAITSVPSKALQMQLRIHAPKGNVYTNAKQTMSTSVLALFQIQLSVSIRLTTTSIVVQNPMKIKVKIVPKKVDSSAVAAYAQNLVLREHLYAKVHASTNLPHMSQVAMNHPLHAKQIMPISMKSSQMDVKSI
jgi:hypothetical protein